MEDCNECREVHRACQVFAFDWDGRFNTGYYVGYLHGLGWSDRVQYDTHYQTLMYFVNYMQGFVNLEGEVVR